MNNVLVERKQRPSIHETETTAQLPPSISVWQLFQFAAACALVPVFWKFWQFHELATLVSLCLAMTPFAIAIVLIVVHQESGAAVGFARAGAVTMILSLLSLPVFLDSTYHHWIKKGGETTFEKTFILANPFGGDISSVSNEHVIREEVGVTSDDGHQLTCNIALTGLFLDTEQPDIGAVMVGFAADGDANQYIDSSLEETIRGNSINLMRSMTADQILLGQTDSLPHRIWDESKGLIQRLKLTADEKTSLKLSCTSEEKFTL
jgi:hypothetical protein